MKPTEAQEGLGIKGMRHRAAAIGGGLDVARGEEGTVVWCWWP
jgi:signal transduction histidine kinase